MGRGGEKVISGSGYDKKRVKKIGKKVGNENKNLVLGYFGSASKFWARFYGFRAGWGKKAAPRKEKKYATPLKKYCPAI